MDTFLILTVFCIVVINDNTVVLNAPLTSNTWLKITK